MVNCTGIPLAGEPPLAFNCTTRGEPKEPLMVVDWLFPETICNPVTVMLGIAVTVNVMRLVVSEARAAVTWKLPVAVEAKRTVFEVRPFASVVVVELPKNTEPAGETVQ